MTDHLKAWRAYCEARAAKEALFELWKSAIKKEELAERDLVNALIEAGQSGIKEPGVTVSLEELLTFHCNQSNVQEVEEWLTETVGDAETFKTTKIDRAMVHEHLRKLLDTGTMIEDLPHFLEARRYPKVKVLGWRKKKEEMTP